MPNEFLDKRFSPDGRRIITDEHGKVYSSQDASTFFEEVTEKEVYGSPRYRENPNHPSLIQKPPVQRSIELLDQLFREAFHIEQAPTAPTVDRRKEDRMSQALLGGTKKIKPIERLVNQSFFVLGAELF